MIKQIFLMLCLLMSTTAQAAPQETLSKEKDHRVAVILELFIPMAGNIYADNSVRGLAPNLVGVTGSALLAVGSFNHFTYELSNGLSGSPMTEKQANIYLSMAILGRTWALIECFQGTTRYNKKLYAIKPVILPNNDGFAYGVQLEF